jgi:hypothetical protein
MCYVSTYTHYILLFDIVNISAASTTVCHRASLGTEDSFQENTSLENIMRQEREKNIR